MCESLAAYVAGQTEPELTLIFYVVHLLVKRRSVGSFKSLVGTTEYLNWQGRASRAWRVHV